MTSPAPERRAPKIVVVGSLNIDLTYRVSRLPLPGETVRATDVFTGFGGKGANQAVAVARAGGAASLIGCVGTDDAGTRYLARLRTEGVGVDGVGRADAPTGSAAILVDERGENCIVVNAGANHAIAPADIDLRGDEIRRADALLAQLECPLAVVKRAAEIARAAGVLVVVNPSPWNDDFPAAGIPADVLIVNEHEAEALGEQPAEVLVVITRGAGPTRARRDGRTVEATPPRVEPVDTVGAGDAFAGALVVALAEGRPLESALDFANVAGALATLRPGAQEAIPRRVEIEERLKSLRKDITGATS
jgi:ribokinase